MNKSATLFLLVCLSMELAYASTPPPDMQIRELEKGLYLHTSFQIVEGFGPVDSNGLVVVVGKDAYIIDTPWSEKDTEKLVDWITERGLDVKAGISTHFHADRTAGIGFLNARSIPTYASKLTNDFLEKAGEPRASNSFDDASYELLADQIAVFYPGGGHSPDNIVVWLPGHEVLFGGCFVRAKETNNLGNTGDAVIEEWADSAEKLLLRYKGAKMVIPGHGNLGDISLLDHTRKLALSASNQSDRTTAE